MFLNNLRLETPPTQTISYQHFSNVLTHLHFEPLSLLFRAGKSCLKNSLLNLNSFVNEAAIWYCVIYWWNQGIGILAMQQAALSRGYLFLLDFFLARIPNLSIENIFVDFLLVLLIWLGKLWLVQGSHIIAERIRMCQIKHLACSNLKAWVTTRLKWWEKTNFPMQIEEDLSREVKESKLSASKGLSNAA